MVLMVGLVLSMGYYGSAQDTNTGPPHEVVSDTMYEVPQTLVSNFSRPKDAGDNPFDVIDDIKNADEWIDLVGLDGAVLTLLMIVLGYLSKFIPILNKINSNTYRVLTTGVIIVIGLAMFGPSGSMWKGIIAYLISTSTYEVLLKWIFKTPKPEPAV